MANEQRQEIGGGTSGRRFESHAEKGGQDWPEGEVTNQEVDEFRLESRRESRGNAEERT